MNNKLNEEIDQKIADCLNNKANEISAPEDMFFKIRGEILSKGVFYKMKIKFLKSRTAIVVGALCILTTITCAAATNSSCWISTTDRRNDIKEFPTSDIVKNKVNFSPKYVEKFDCGFKFDSFNYADTSDKNDEGNVVAKTKQAEFEYKRDDTKKGEFLSMSAMDISNQQFNEDIKTNNDKYPASNIVEYNGIKIYYNSVHNKCVPPKYQKTEEDIKLINEGLLEISFGSNEIEEHENQSVEWCEDGIEYCIVNQDYNDIDKDAMIQMAKTVINQ